MIDNAAPPNRNAIGAIMNVILSQCKRLSRFCLFAAINIITINVLLSCVLAVAEEPLLSCLEEKRQETCLITHPQNPARIICQGSSANRTDGGETGSNMTDVASGAPSLNGYSSSSTQCGNTQTDYYSLVLRDGRWIRDQLIRKAGKECGPFVATTCTSKE